MSEVTGPINGGLRVLSAVRRARRATPSWRPPPEQPLAPVHRTIVAVDIEASTARTDVAKARLRTVMYDLLETALLECGIDEAHRDPPNDRGDGAFVLIHPVDQAPKPLLLSTFIPVLADMLAEYAARHEDPIRL